MASRKSKRPKNRTEWDESDILFVVDRFRKGRRIAEIASALAEEKQLPATAVTRHRVISLLQRAFQDGYVVVEEKDTLRRLLATKYPGVQFRVLFSRLTFSFLAARQVLEWLAALCGPNGLWAEDTYAAIGGGETMAQLVAEIPAVLRNPENRDLAKRWRLAELKLINATAGARPQVPDKEASFLTCRFAEAVREGCGADKVRPVVHTTSLDPSRGEREVVEKALERTRAIVSGVGARTGAYCLEAIREKTPLSPADEKVLVGEILYHPFKEKGDPIPVPGIAVKDSRGARKRTGSPMLATLFSFEFLAGESSAVEGRTRPALIAVVNCTPETCKEKAVAVRVLLEKRILSHVCLSADVAEAIVDQLDRDGARG